MGKVKTRARYVKIDMRGIGVRTSKLKSSKALGVYASAEAMRLMDKYVPFRTGNLAGSVRNEPWKVVYVAPYANYVYVGRGMTFSKQVHPLARSYWDRPLRRDPQQLADAIEPKVRQML